MNLNALMVKTEKGAYKYRKFYGKRINVLKTKAGGGVGKMEHKLEIITKLWCFIYVHALFGNPTTLQICTNTYIFSCEISHAFSP